MSRSRFQNNIVPMVRTEDGRSIVERANFEHLCATLRATVYELRGSCLKVCFRHPTFPGIDCEFTAYRYDYQAGRFAPAHDITAPDVLVPVSSCAPFGAWFANGGSHQKEWFTAQADIRLTGKGSRDGLLRHRLDQLIYDVLAAWNR